MWLGICASFELYCYYKLSSDSPNLVYNSNITIICYKSKGSQKFIFFTNKNALQIIDLQGVMLEFVIRTGVEPVTY